MSLFGRGPSAAPPAGQTSDALHAAQMEVEMVSDLFKRLTETCWTKCIGASSRFTGGDLEKAEGVCNDRCVAKWFAASDLIGRKMQEAQPPGGL
ncbi:inner membrane translocase subunit [Atractiella rhizophila]|nr:inner membrane translocase subunit [Atractiella rhizophila]KAH8927357.1 inner membrane translocase subunit [Atractiella rhizophila]